MSDLLINGIGSPDKGSLKEDVCAAAKDASPSRIVAATDMLVSILLMLWVLLLSRMYIGWAAVGPAGW